MMRPSMPIHIEFFSLQTLFESTGEIPAPGSRRRPLRRPPRPSQRIHTRSYYNYIKGKGRKKNMNIAPSTAHDPDVIARACKFFTLYLTNLPIPQSLLHSQVPFIISRLHRPTSLFNLYLFFRSHRILLRFPPVPHRFRASAHPVSSPC